MSDPDLDLADCLTRLSAGDQQAARDIYERFVHRLVRLAGRHLDRKLGPLADPESVAHSVFESFFDRQRGGRFELHTWGMVFGLLAHITFRKCLNRNRAARRAKRGSGEATETFEDWKAADVDPGPAEAAEVADLLERVLAGFDPEQRAILDAYLGGATTEQVATRVKLTVRTVQRVVERFRTLLLEQLSAP